jgi:hypothetical protein
MSAAQEIAKLDRQIAKKGQTVSLRKSTAVDGAQDRPIRAFVRGYKPDELAGGVQQGDSTVIISPTALAASGFTGSIKRNDVIVVSERARRVEVANLVTMDDQTVRIEVWIKG